MKTTYDIIKENLELGHIVLASTENRRTLTMSMKTKITFIHILENGTIHSLVDTWTSEEINKQIDPTTIKVIPRIPKELPSGTKVVIMDEVRETEGWNDLHAIIKEMVGKILEIKYCDFGKARTRCAIYTEDKSNYFFFDARYVRPALPHEIEATKRTITAEEARKAITEKYGDVVVDLSEVNK